MRLSILGLAVAAVTLGAVSAQASLLVYEGFDYSTGNLGSPYTTTNNPQVSSGSLSYSGFPVGGSSAGNTLAPGASATYYRSWNVGSTASTPADGTYFYSLLVNAASASTSKGTFIPFGITSDPQNGFGVRVDTGTTSCTIKAWTQVQAAGTSLNLSAGTTHLIIGKVVFSGGSATNSIWLDPADYSSETALGASPSSMSSSATLATTTLSGRSFGGSAGLSWDEVRVGTTLADVTSVPEPAMLGLIGLASASLIGRRRAR